MDADEIAVINPSEAIVQGYLPRSYYSASSVALALSLELTRKAARSVIVDHTPELGLPEDPYRGSCRRFQIWGKPNQ